MLFTFFKWHWGGIWKNSAWCLSVLFLSENRSSVLFDCNETRKMFLSLCTCRVSMHLLVANTHIEKNVCNFQNDRPLLFQVTNPAFAFCKYSSHEKCLCDFQNDMPFLFQVTNSAFACCKYSSHENCVTFKVTSPSYFKWQILHLLAANTLPTKTIYVTFKMTGPSYS